MTKLQRFVFALVTLLLANRAFADGVTTAVSCGGLSATSTCTQGAEYSQEGYSSASSSASGIFSNNSGSASISLSVSALDGFNSINNEIVGSGATASANIDYTLTTSGPVSPGLLQISFPQFQLQGSGNGLYITESLTIGSFQESCSLVDGDYTQCEQLSQTVIPFELGESYNFDYSVTATATDNDFDYPSGSFSGTVNFQAMNAPEPSSWTLVLCVLLFVPFILSKRQKASKRSPSRTRSST